MSKLHKEEPNVEFRNNKYEFYTPKLCNYMCFIIICSYFHINHEIPSQHGILKLKYRKSTTNETSKT